MFVDEEPNACDRHFSRYVLFLDGVGGARCLRRVLPQRCLLMGGGVFFGPNSNWGKGASLEGLTGSIYLIKK